MLRPRLQKNIKFRIAYNKTFWDRFTLQTINSTLFLIQESKQNVNSNFSNKNEPLNYAWKHLFHALNYYLAHHSKFSISTRSRNLCLISGRSRGVYRFCKLTRMQIKKLAGMGLLPGLRASSW